MQDQELLCSTRKSEPNSEDRGLMQLFTYEHSLHWKTNSVVYSTKPPGLLLSDELIIDICLPTVSVEVLMTHFLCFTNRTHPQKQVTNPLFYRSRITPFII